uniref:Uncharacterized protein n=1 Tax=Xanthomonas vasicola pv. vasculorum NCPPB 890 TaxID=1184265 RepID=A0A837B673_XANVA
MGSKREAASYRRIAERIGVPPSEILFLSDVIEELDAAKRTGMRTALLDRREDYPTPRSAADVGSHQRVESFSQLVF